MAAIQSGSITFPQAGRLAISVISATGSGGNCQNLAQRAATGANGPPWGRKVIDVAASDVIAFTLGAGGASQETADTAGNPGGTTTVRLNGSTIITAQGSEGGARTSTSNATISAPVPAATITGCDFWVPGVRAGDAVANSTGFSISGGAAVDLLRNGTGRSPTANAATSVQISDGGCIGSDLGGNNGAPWLIFAQFGLALGDGKTGGSVGIGGISANGAGGIFGGARGASAAPPWGGGGGGGGFSSSGKGSGAFIYLQFVPSE